MQHTVEQLHEDLDRAGIPTGLSANETARRLAAVGLGWRRKELLDVLRKVEFLPDRR